MRICEQSSTILKNGNVIKMTREIKCPNCGQIVTSADGVCPNCDTFSVNNEKIKKEIVTPIVPIESEEIVKEPKEEPKETPKETTKIEKFAPAAAIVSEKQASVEAQPNPVSDAAETDNDSVAAMEPRKEDNNRKSNGGKKAATGLAAVLLMLGGGYGYTKYQENDAADKQVQLEKKVVLAETHLDQFYLNEEKVFLSEKFDSTKLADVSKEIAAIDDEKSQKELDKQLETLTKKSEKLAEANNLFQEPIIKGDKLVEKPVIKADLTKIPTALSAPADDFEKLYNKALSLGKKQLDDNKATKAIMEKLVDKNGKPKKGLSKADYEQGRKLVASLTNKDLKAKYNKQLDVVEKNIKATEKTESEKQEKANQEAANQQAAATDNNQTNAGGSGSVNHGANSDNGTLVKDGIVIHGRTPGSTTEGDWSWAPGVQENFINTAIARGYVTAGGYELRSKEIINGEAYYELYATRRNTGITQEFSESQLPIYIVTVNAKTGSFRGGAANYSDAK